MGVMWAWVAQRARSGWGRFSARRGPFERPKRVIFDQHSSLFRRLVMRDCRSTKICWKTAVCSAPNAVQKQRNRLFFKGWMG